MNEPMCQISCKSNTYNTYPISFKICLILHARGITHNALLSLVDALDDRGCNWENSDADSKILATDLRSVMATDSNSAIIFSLADIVSEIS